MTELLKISTTLNTTLVDVIYKLIDTGRFLHKISDYMNWHNIGSKATKDTGTVFAQQAQRAYTGATLRSLRFTVPQARRTNEGNGVRQVFNGDMGFFSGQLQNNKRHGDGVLWLDGSGRKYDGFWENDKRDGYGTMEWKDKKYEGQLENGYYAWSWNILF
jgi:hypothetical protein